MSFDRPEPGARLNFDTPTTPRVAATVIVIRGGVDTLEVLLVKRTERARVMAGAWVFPGGSVDPSDGEGELAPALAARRELREEAGIELPDAHELVPFARWITPEQIRVRFDTWFFLAAAPDAAEVTVDGTEIVEHLWTTPQAALDARAAERLLLVFPTIKQLQRLAAFESATAALAHARVHPTMPIQPRVIPNGENDFRIVLPGEPGYDG